MVQRKVSNKLGIITPASSDRHVNKSETLKPSFYQQEKSPDLTKKMKKSRSFKISDAESKKLSSTRGAKKNISLPGKPPPVKSPMIDRSSPNYMKSTSSSEHKQVSSLKTNHKSGSSSSKQARALTRNSSLKVTRTLTKIPSFKKSSRLVISVVDTKSQKPTCSSTLKDAKFPPFLELNHGGTEAEGTSAMKVCPYTYCSLNGHHHPPLPPLKCFMSAKRRTLKMQKSFKLGALSPRKSKQRAKTEEIDSGEDFFVEIYAKTEDPDTVEEIYLEINDTGKKFDGPEVSESLSDGSPKSEVDFEENLENYSDFMPIEMEYYSKEQKILEDGESLLVLSQQEASTEGDRASIEEGDNFSETTDMEWEEGRFCPSSPAIGESDLTKDDHEEMIENRDICIDEFIFIDNEKNVAEEVPQDVHEEESACSDAPNENDSEIDEVNLLNSSEVSGSLSCDEDSSAEEFATGEVKQEEIEEMVLESENEIIDQSLQNDDQNIENGLSAYEAIDERLHAEVVEHDISKKDEDPSKKRQICTDSEEQGRPKLRKIESDANNINKPADTPEVNNANTGIVYTHGTTNGAKPDSRRKYLYGRGSTGKNIPEQFDPLKWTIGRGRPLAEKNEDSWKFNPAEPNYLPLTPEPEKEKVDLKHQTTDDRKNSEEFMSDYALQQAVSKLAQAKKKKVALLVAAFETVSPVSKIDSPHLAPTRFTHSRPMQACS